nr:MAG: replication initiator protein [Microvirus sp.]
MACFYPLQAFASPAVKGVKRVISFNVYDKRFQNVPPTPLSLPCGQCIGCRLQRSQHWAIRCMHELQFHQKACFITLTYNKENLPADGSLNTRDFQLFMKRLRKKFGSGIRFFHCGEYGDKLGRPHHHAIIFGFDFDDKEFFKRTGSLSAIYRSPSLEKLWPFGFSSIGAVTYESVAYVARYVMKKVNGKNSAEHYGAKKPEYITMSRNPGIAYQWFQQYHKDVFPDDFCFTNKMSKIKPPRYYDSQFEILDPDAFFSIQQTRRKRAKALKASGALDAERLEAKNAIVSQRVKKLIRPLDVLP